MAARAAAKAGRQGQQDGNSGHGNKTKRAGHTYPLLDSTAILPQGQRVGPVFRADLKAQSGMAVEQVYIGGVEGETNLFAFAYVWAHVAAQFQQCLVELQVDDRAVAEILD